MHIHIMGFNTVFFINRLHSQDIKQFRTIIKGQLPKVQHGGIEPKTIWLQVELNHPAMPTLNGQIP